MNYTKLHKVFSTSDCLPTSILHDYLKDKLSDGQRHEVEKHLTDCELCADRLEGLSVMSAPEQLDDMVQAINLQIAQKAGQTKVKPLVVLRNYKWAALAASFLLLIAGGFYLHNTLINNKFSGETSQDIKTEQAAEQSNKLQDDMNESSIAETPESDTTSPREDDTPIKKSAEDINLRRNEADTQFEEEIAETPEYVRDREFDMVIVDDQADEEFETNDEIQVERAKSEKRKSTRRGAVTPSENDYSDNLHLRSQESIKHRKTFGNFFSWLLPDKNAMAQRQAKAAPSRESRSKGDMLKDETATNRQENKLADVVAEDETKLVEDQAATFYTFEGGMAYYKAGDYENAGIVFEALLQQNEQATDPQLMYYAGMSFYHQEQHKKAIEHFNKQLNLQDNAFTEDARWHKALSFIELDQKDEATQILKAIIEENGRFADQAKEELQKFDH